MASVTSLDQDMRKLRHDRYTPGAANEIRSWIEAMLGERLTAGDLMEALKDGVALCKLVNQAVSPGVKYKESNMPFVQMENISHFLRACEMPPLNLPAHDRFLTVDLYDGKDPAQVLQCIAAFSRKANAINPSNFPYALGGKSKATMSPQGTGSSTGPRSPAYTTTGSNRPRGTSTATESEPVYTFNPLNKAAYTTSGRTSPTKPATTLNRGGLATGGTVSSWSKREDEGKSAPAWNIHQYGYMGGASQGNLGVAFGARRQITSESPKVPTLAEKEKRLREKLEQEQREAEEQARKDREQREAEAEQARLEEEQAQREEERRWQEETRKQRAKEEEDARRWEEDQRQRKEQKAAEIRQREKEEADARQWREEQRQRKEKEAAEFREREEERKWLEREQQKQQFKLEQEAAASQAREAQQANQRNRQRTTSDTRLNGQFLSQYQAEQSRPSNPTPATASASTAPLATQAAAESQRIADLERQLEELRVQQRQATVAAAASPPPAPQLVAAEPALPPRPLPNPSSYNTPPPAAKPAVKPTAGGGGWASKSLLEREMERERQRQEEWEEAQKATASAARDTTAGSRPGQSWDVHQYGYMGGDSQNRGGAGLGVGGARRQIIGPRPPP